MSSQQGTDVFSVTHPVYSAQYPISQGDRIPEDDEWKPRYLDNTLRAAAARSVEGNRSMTL